MGIHKNIVFVLAFQKISLPLHNGCSHTHTFKSHKIVKMQSQHCLFTMGNPTPFIYPDSAVTLKISKGHQNWYAQVEFDITML